MGRGPTASYHKDMMEGYVKGSLTCLSEGTIKNEINTDFPLVLNVEPTNACNLKCYICPRNKSGREVGYMDFELYTRIIDQCLEHKQLRMLNFHKDGEPLLHPKLFEMIKYAKDSNAAKILHLNTNAVCLEGDNIERFLISGIDDVTISLDAYYPETFEKIKGRALLGKVENTVVNLFRTRDRLKLEKPFIRIKIMEFEDTYGEIEDFIKKWQDIADDIQVTGLHDWSGSIEDVEVTDENQCQVNESYTLVKRLESCVTVYEIITPDGDGYNDTWVIEGIEIYPNATVQVYDRWGRRVFYSQGYPQQWDGIHKGKVLPMDSYHYIINLNNDTSPIIGNITIVK